MQSPTVVELKLGISTLRRMMTIFSDDDFFVQATNLKYLLTDPLFFKGFVFGEASSDGHRMIDWQKLLIDILM